jgi:hypothetical protein
MNPTIRRSLLLATTIAATFVIFVSCSKKESEENDEDAVEEAAPVEASAPGIVIAMIEAHGGMASWRAAKTVSFESEFTGPGDSASTVTRVMVDQQRRRAYIDFPNTGERMAWDGKRAWSINWQQPYPPRFAALLDYYFLDLPWLTMDPGVKLTVAGTDSLWDDPTAYKVVKMSFRPGTGDTPGDTYHLYIDPESKRLKACKYQMTYRSLMPDSGNAMPEHVVVYEDHTRVDGLLVPTRYSIYRMDHSAIGTCLVRDWSFDEPFDEKKMAMPDSAVVDQSKP